MMPPAISGQGGHNATFRVACVLVAGFGLDVGHALPVLQEWNIGCNPQWSERDLLHKLKDAAKQPGERNYLRNVPQEPGRACPFLNTRALPSASRA